MRFLLLIFPVLLILSECPAQSKRPKIGLTLSGGGAKGLSHIGILKAIDSAGLKIDMVTGTSMGSIMGALYAVGYSGKDIEAIARSIDWGKMFSNRPPLDLINMNEKREFANYAIEVPLEKGKAKLYTGFIEAEEIWLRFGELFYPVHDVKDFSKFNIPFRCIATDVATGKAVVLKEGEIVKAVRSSMAIPSVFTSIPYKTTKLVDGGLVRNFPVRDALAMGADYVIGVNLSTGLQPAEKLQTPIDILYQMGFYKDADDFSSELKLCNLLIQPRVDMFSAASFGSADSLIAIGNATGRKYYPYFKKLADSLNALYPGPAFQESRLPRVDRTILDGIEAAGLSSTDIKDFEGKLGLKRGAAYSGKELASAVRKAYSSGNFRRLAFYIEPTQPGHSVLKCDVVEYPPTYLKVGLHYHTYSDVALITTLSTRNLLFNRSKSFVKINWGSNSRGLARHDQAFGKQQRWGTLLSFYHEQFKFPLYQDFKQDYLYRSIYSDLDLKFYKLLGATSMSGFGMSREWLTLKPEVSPDQVFNGHNTYWNLYYYFQRNSLDMKSFPHSGSYINLQAGIIFGQNNNFTYTSSDGSISSDTIAYKFSNYEQIKFKAGKYFPLREKFTLISQFNNGINFNYNQAFLNFYSVGGINDFIRNQVTFVGLAENQVNTNSISAFLLGLQYEPVPNLIATFRANVGVYNYITTTVKDLNHNNFLSGYAISGGYRSLIGPIEISLMYCDQSKGFRGYVNMGFTF
jgi:NTE family protein